MTHYAKVGFVPVAASLVMSCGGVERTPAQSAPVPTKGSSVAEARPIDPPQGYSWIVQGELAAKPLPGRYRALEQDVAYLEQDGIRVLVSLTENPPDGAALGSQGIGQDRSKRLLKRMR